MQGIICFSLLVLLAGNKAFAFVRQPFRVSTGLTTSATSRYSASAENADAAQADSQNIWGIISDTVTGSVFSLLHAFDANPIKDSSKNLRVLWVRALLHEHGRLKDPIAKLLLPQTTVGVVKLMEQALPFTEWVQARTDFIDSAVDDFLASSNNDASPQIVLVGAGYDTRMLRYRESKATFFEVDLPVVCEGKQILYNAFQQKHDPAWEQKSNKLIPLDLNDCGDSSEQKQFLKTLQRTGDFDPTKPTLFIFEAVLFYVKEAAIRNIMQDIYNHAAHRNPETLLCMTDSLKPFVTVPFSNEARKYFKSKGMDLLQHRSRWGGAVHFSLAAAEGGMQGVRSRQTGGGIVNSYTPTQSNNPALLKNPSFENAWYAVAYPWQIDGYATPLDAVLKRKPNKPPAPFATRLWGQPLVLYRDNAGELVAMTDVCPHRSVPLSMGRVNEQNELVCAYHGWTFGEKGACTRIPTATSNEEKFMERVTASNCGNHKAVVEHEGLVYIWRGNILEADPALLPTRRKGDMETVPIDTVLDYNVDYSYIVENNLDSPHLFYLHDGSVPPIESIGMLNENLPKLKLTAFTDDCGMGHLGSLESSGRPKKLIRFDPPNIVRHGGVSGFEEEFHVIPIAPQRTRVLLRQHLPRGPILSTISSLPGVLPILTLLVNHWNYHISLEDSCIMQGQANRIEYWAAPRLAVGGLGDDLIKRYWTWRRRAHDALVTNETDLSSPYYVDFSSSGPLAPTGIPSGTAFGDDPKVVEKVRKDAKLRNSPMVMESDLDEEGNPVGAWGIKFAYIQDTPAANFPPINYKRYKSLLAFDDVAKRLFRMKEKADEEKQQPPTSTKGKRSLPRNSPKGSLKPTLVYQSSSASGTGMNATTFTT